MEKNSGMKNSDELHQWITQAYKAKGNPLPDREINTVIRVGVGNIRSAQAAMITGEMIYSNQPFSLIASGYAISADYWLPDTGEIGPTTLLREIKKISKTTLKHHHRAKILADLDHGYGGPKEAAKLVSKVIPYGIAGINIEDQQPLLDDESMADIRGIIEEKFGKIPKHVKRWLKSCGHIGSKVVLIPGRIGGGKVVLPLPLMLKKIAAIAEARNLLEKIYGHVIINARTDVFSTYNLNQGWEALKDAVKRGNAFLEAGADMVFYEAVPPFEDIDQKEAIIWLIKNTKGPVSINGLLGGKTTIILTLKEVNGWGAASLSFPIDSVRVELKALTDLYVSLFKTGSNANVNGLNFKEVNDALDWPGTLIKILNSELSHEIAKQGGIENTKELVKSINGSYGNYIASLLK